MSPCRHPYRIFISYSHVDLALAERLQTYLAAINTIPVLDKDISGGMRFSEEIRRKISYAHVFLSILTRHSKTSPWVHQELGYAMGLGLPVLPLALDELPAGMAQEIQALRITPDMQDLGQHLTVKILDGLVESTQDAHKAMFECADQLHERTRMLVGYAKHLLQSVGPCRIRQRMAFSSFSLPDRNAKHPDWDLREGTDRRPDEVRRDLRLERSLMEQHAREAGCDLILDPYVGAEEGKPPLSEPRLKHELGPSIKRLQILKEFMEHMPDDKLRVGICRGKIDGSLSLIGDWVSAEAVVPHYKGGYKQTIFTRHAPTVLAKVEEFDRDLEELIDEAETKGLSSRQAAIRTLEGIINEHSGA